MIEPCRQWVKMNSLLTVYVCKFNGTHNNVTKTYFKLHFNIHYSTFMSTDGPVFTKVLYMFLSFWLLRVESHDFSHVKKEITD